ncbi:MAG TPA: hypothetical protein VHD81_10795 [Mycobacteriales bacterium]|nr:hypothetical protein [Mycobacteriales bacterium]
MAASAVDIGVGSQHKVQIAGRVLIAAALGVMAGIHLQLYSTYGYKALPTIGALFLTNGIAGSLLCLAILGVPSRYVGLAALASAGLLAGTLAGFVVALHHPLFGFQDSIHAPHAWTALIDEAVGALIAIGLAAGSLRGRRLRTAVVSGWRRA